MQSMGGGIAGEHELRRIVVSEMHLRRWPALVPDCTVIQILRQLSDEEREAECAALADFPAQASVEPSPNRLWLGTP